MRKIIIGIAIFLVLFSVGTFLYIRHIFSAVNSPSPVNYTDLLSRDSYWEDISNDDIKNLVAGSYTEPILKTISRLESGIPVILYVVNGRFDNTGEGNFIVLSAFTQSGKIYTYIPKNEGYTKGTYSIEEVFENTKKVLLLNESGVVL